MKIRPSLIAIGLGTAAYKYVRKTNMLSRKSINKARKVIKSYL